jgi:hypothetical protein
MVSSNPEFRYWVDGVGWIRTRHITALDVSPQTLNYFSLHEFNTYPFLAYIYFTQIILTKLYNFNYYGVPVTQLTIAVFL